MTECERAVAKVIATILAEKYPGTTWRLHTPAEPRLPGHAYVTLEGRDMGPAERARGASDGR